MRKAYPEDSKYNQRVQRKLSVPANLTGFTKVKNYTPLKLMHCSKSCRHLMLINLTNLGASFKIKRFASLDLSSKKSDLDKIGFSGKLLVTLIVRMCNNVKVLPCLQFSQ